uniref:Uncharacterized protein n=1 Tax=Chromera velia CCMP2878 TaxID=1169474 RepID=A0A0G4HCG6_9ALVE|eukprot:Cvel_26115.t1-p1 / transcript=Cvel_26115.t1 / gene=Cvel_26115 / organism=Chromera_velia_CCMP2878 / gene_product=Centrosome-associated protein CEP250, putative / transcript_product=Centrosome-associated protein CEP250, putative / location=Cvel_scaffold3055:3169-5468(-) / protein_length=739 / sequence_SO=supercontig / SO=protein_coding / is_pseudo=false
MDDSLAQLAARQIEGERLEKRNLVYEVERRDSIIGALREDLKAKEAAIHSLTQRLDRASEALYAAQCQVELSQTQSREDAEQRVQLVQSELTASKAHAAALSQRFAIAEQQLTKKDAEIRKLHQVIAERDREVTRLNAVLQELRFSSQVKDVKTADLDRFVANREAEFRAEVRALQDRHATETASLKHQTDAALASQNAQTVLAEREASELRSTLTEREEEIRKLAVVMAEKDREHLALRRRADALDARLVAGDPSHALELARASEAEVRARLLEEIRKSESLRQDAQLLRQARAENVQLCQQIDVLRDALLGLQTETAALTVGAQPEALAQPRLALPSTALASFKYSASASDPLAILGGSGQQLAVKKGTGAGQTGGVGVPVDVGPSWQGAGARGGAVARPRASAVESLQSPSVSVSPSPPSPDRDRERDRGRAASPPSFLRRAAPPVTHADMSRYHTQQEDEKQREAGVGEPADSIQPGGPQPRSTPLFASEEMTPPPQPAVSGRDRGPQRPPEFLSLLKGGPSSNLPKSKWQRKPGGGGSPGSPPETAPLPSFAMPSKGGTAGRGVVASKWSDRDGGYDSTRAVAAFGGGKEKDTKGGGGGGDVDGFPPATGGFGVGMEETRGTRKDKSGGAFGDPSPLSAGGGGQGGDLPGSLDAFGAEGSGDFFGFPSPSNGSQQKEKGGGTNGKKMDGKTKGAQKEEDFFGASATAGDGFGAPVDFGGGADVWADFGGGFNGQ